MASDDPEVVITEEQAGAVNHRVVKRGGRVLRGFDAELAQKHLDEWDNELEQKALDWIFLMTGERVAKIADLRSGIVLCQLINRIRPSLIPRFSQGATITPLHQRDNIRLYLDACRKLGVSGAEVFMVEDLYEEKYLPGVLKNIFSLGRLLQMRTSWYGPKLEAIKLPSWMAPSEDSLEPLVKQLAQELTLPPMAAETALTVLSAHRVRNRRQLHLLAANPHWWALLTITPSSLKEALRTIGLVSTASKSRGRRWPWLVLPILLGGVGLFVWRTPKAIALFKRFKFEVSR